MDVLNCLVFYPAFPPVFSEFFLLSSFQRVQILARLSQWALLSACGVALLRRLKLWRAGTRDVLGYIIKQCNAWDQFREEQNIKLIQQSPYPRGSQLLLNFI